MFIGQIISGEVLIDNVGFKRRLFEAYPAAIGGEMEAAGLYAASSRASKEWIMVKGISDWADGMKDERHQSLAAAAASSLVRYVLASNTALDGVS